MKILGIIVEYNPFHNGHILHIKKAKELINPDITIAIMSSSFVQRGEPAIIDKWTRSKLAINYGVDLVIELPFVYSVQSADYFAKGAIKLLKEAGVTDLCFGSETGNIEEFILVSKAIYQNEQMYQSLVKQAMNQGLRYPDACNQALHKITGHQIKTPNDLLGLAYVKEVMKYHDPIQLHCIKRTNDYHSNTLQQISSATSIRNALKNKQDVSFCLPQSTLYQTMPLFYLEDFFPYLKYRILLSSSEQLSNLHLVEEGLEHLMKTKIIEADNMTEFISLLQSKRYTKTRIQRMLIHVLMNNTKQEIQEAMDVDYIRILAMNQNGKNYLNKWKKTCSFHLISNFSSYQHPALTLEQKATNLLSFLLKETQDTFIKNEYQNFPYIKKE